MSHHKTFGRSCRPLHAKLDSVDEERAMFEDPSTRLWLTGAQKQRYEQQQLSYTKEYQADYHDFDQLTHLFGQTDLNSTDSKDNTNKDKSPETKQNDIPKPSEFRRSRRGRLPFISGIGSIARSLTYDLEATSTIMPPTEACADADFTSNVNVEEIRKKYFSNYQANNTLPIYKYRSMLLNSINTYSVVIIQGQTGCGKTTQVPTYILEDAILDRNLPKAPVIYVTQPRRIAAKSIAKRVADEHDWNLGEIVGYQVGLERVTCENTILTYCTSGVLLQKLIGEKSLKSYSHIIIDEAHERDSDTDLLLMMIRNLMRREKSFFRLIVMSATIELTKLKNYFTFKTCYGHNAITVPSICRINIESTENDVQIAYIDKLSDSFGIYDKIPVFDISQPDLLDVCLEIGVKIVVDVIPKVDSFRKSTQTILVFLPGLAEITRFHQMLAITNTALDIIPLHSCLPHVDQIRIFMPSDKGYRKVILATNIAESSITVKDAGFIVDFCLTKNLKKDIVTSFPMLKLDWCSKDKLTQRAGRTGRCCPGKVFRLITSSFYKELPEYAEPELLISPLELSVLKIKNFDMGTVKALLAVVLDPPPLQEIKTAVLELKQIGALTATYEGKLSDEDGDLTELGKVISKLPIDVHLSKLILIASLLDVHSDAITVAASLSTNRTVVKHLYNNDIASYENKLRWAKGSQSDLFVTLDVYREYMYNKQEMGKDSRFMENFCNNKNLDERKLQEITALADEITYRLKSLNIEILDQPNRQRDRHQDELMLKVAFCASFYPNYFITQELDAADIDRELLGHDPSRTVLISGLPSEQAPLYRTQILNQLQNRIPHQIEYYADTSRAMIKIMGDDDDVNSEETAFEALGVTGVIQTKTKISKWILPLLKAADSGHPIFIREYKPQHALDRMQYYRDQKAAIDIQRLIPPLLKVVVGRDPDNTHLTDSSDDEYSRFLTTNYYTEVEFNSRQDADDMQLLADFEKQEKHMMSQPSSVRARFEEQSIFDEIKLLKGPYTPIQMRFMSILRKSRGYNVNIDPNSINSILLDADYKKCRRQMLVAASVGQTQKCNRIIARDTTLMPNIIGLPTLMTLLFARSYRLIYNEKMCCYSGAIISLGWDDQGNTLRPDYEIELEFDVHIVQDDLDLINIARKNISSLISFIEVANPGAPKAQLQDQLRQIILALIRKRRHQLKPVDFAVIDWRSGNFTRDNHNMDETGSIDSIQNQYPLFLPPLVTSKNVQEPDLMKTLRNNLDRLDRIERGEEKMVRGGVQCLLCGNAVDHLFILRSKLIQHVYSDSHIHLLEKFEKSEERSRIRAESANL